MGRMSELPRTSGRPTGSARGRWWTAVTISTAVYLMLLPPAGALRGLAEMMTDPCDGPASCPSTRAHLAVADYGLFTLLALIVLQWPVVYLIPRGRVLVTLLPGVALAVAVVAMFTIEGNT